MRECSLEKVLYLGVSRRKVSEVVLSISDLQSVGDGEFSIRVKASGVLEPADRLVNACSPFDCLILALAFLRQRLRATIKSNPRLKIFEKIHDDELFKLTVDEVFWTEDCITDELQDVIDWAMENGYQTSS